MYLCAPTSNHHHSQPYGFRFLLLLFLIFLVTGILFYFDMGEWWDIIIIIIIVFKYNHLFIKNALHHTVLNLNSVEVTSHNLCLQR